MISCHIHDYIEIACMYQIGIKLTLQDDSEFIGKGITTHYNNQKEECMTIKTNSGTIDIVLTKIKTMTALDENSHFQTVIFK